MRVQHLALLMITLGLGFLTYELANALCMAHRRNGRPPRRRQLADLRHLRLRPLGPHGLRLRARHAVHRRSSCAAGSSTPPSACRSAACAKTSGACPRSARTTARHLQTVYTISAAIAGVAGALLTQTTETVSLDVLSFQRSADVVVMLILGGTGRLYGGIVGAIIFLVARDQLSDMNPQYWYFWIGLLLMVVVLVMPQGILGGFARIFGKRG